MKKIGVLVFVVFIVVGLVGVGYLEGQTGGIQPCEWGTGTSGGCCPNPVLDIYVAGCGGQGGGGGTGTGGQPGGIQPEPRDRGGGNGQGPLWNWLSSLLNIPQGIIQGFNNIFNVPPEQPPENVFVDVPEQPRQDTFEDNIVPEDDSGNAYFNVPPEEICTYGINLITGGCCWAWYFYILQPGCRGENRPESRPIIEEPSIEEDALPEDDKDCPYWVLGPEGWKCPDSFAGTIYGGDCDSNDDCNEGYICTGYENNPKICAFISESAETSALASNKLKILEWFKRILFG